MILVFTSFLIVYIIVGTTASLYVMNSQRTNQLHESALQSIEIVKSNIESNIDSINNVSKIIILNPYVRQYLKSPYNNISYRSILYQKFTQLYVVFPFIESIFIYDFDSNGVNASREVTFSSIEKIQDTPWFKEVVNAKGKYLININAGGTLNLNSGKNTISMIRILYDLDDITPIGLLIINTSQDFFSFTTKDDQSKYATSFILLDESENLITKNSHQDNFSLIESASDYKVGKICKINGHKYFVLSSKIPQHKWTIVSYTPINIFGQTTRTFKVLLIILILCSAIVFIVSSFFTAKVVTTPIKKLIYSMVGVRKGIFETVHITTGNDEIGELKNTYNIMIIEIKMTQEYLSLQKLRYGDIIHDQYNLSLNTLKIPILKNTLQPLVENCINHGIKPSGETGTIVISSRIKNNLLYVTVADDGLGMSADKIALIEADFLDENTASFGLRGTVARLKLYYGTSNLYEIQSKPFAGTSITLKIPIIEVKNE